MLETGRRRRRMRENWQRAECVLSLEILALNSSCRQVWSRMREDIWRSVVFSLIVTSKEAQCYFLSLLPWEQPLTFMWGSRYSVPNCSLSTSLTFFFLSFLRPPGSTSIFRKALFQIDEVKNCKIGLHPSILMQIIIYHMKRAEWKLQME